MGSSARFRPSAVIVDPRASHVVPGAPSETIRRSIPVGHQPRLGRPHDGRSETAVGRVVYLRPMSFSPDRYGAPCVRQGQGVDPRETTNILYLKFSDRIEQTARVRLVTVASNRGSPKRFDECASNLGYSARFRVS
ncbi:hypothetical protein D8S78_21695 [Natrialba swarupiae]|nr:hypothetical protein [Natrialba swarupiae]